jgi:hypothetical protein
MHTTKRTRNRADDWQVIGVDSETMQGPPISFQFYSAHAKQINACVFVGKKKPTEVFFAHLKKLKPGRYRMYGHNLEFDMLSILWDIRATIRDGSIDADINDFKITGRYSKPVFATIDDGERYIEVVDSILWFQTSLEKAAERVCPDLPKLTRPAGLGITMYTAKDHTFVDYAMRDAEVAFFLGLAIERFHEELQIPSQISLASMAAAVFRIHYMQANIYQPPLHQWMVGAAASYHGGVNRVRPNSAPSWHLNVSALDLSSAYPHAMDGFPAFSDEKGFKKFKQSSVRRVPELGIYQISGTTSDCDWPALFNHDFSPLQGKFRDVWVSGFELNEALATHEVSLKSISGFHYDSRAEGNGGYSPFRQYVQEFYKQKSDAADPVMRYMYKILLNALTGKFIQTSPDYTLADGKLIKIMRAGGLYHPFIASLITGHTRAAIHAAEHKYKAIHTATDGIFVPGKVDTGQKKRLGALVSEGQGDLALFRNKLYIFYTDDSSNGDAYESQVFKGRYVMKCARHGFQGRVVDLEQMLVSPNRSYKTNKPIKLKTALKNKDVPNKFIIEERKLRNIGDFAVQKYG